MIVESLLAEPLVRAPELQGTRWLNSPPLRLSDLRGQVVLVDFWDYTCVNCLRTLPYLREWHRRYAPLGLVIIGVHAPEFPFAREVSYVERGVREYDLQYPVMLDNDYRTWQAFANRYWPAKYLIDHNGYLRYAHFGEGRYQDTEQAIQLLLHLRDPHLEFPEPMGFVRDSDKPGARCYRVTPELYLGYERGRIGNPEGYQPDQVVHYIDPLLHQENCFYASGPWLNRADALVTAQAAPASIALRYTASEVNLVMAPEKAPAVVSLRQNQEPLAPIDRGEDVQVAADGDTFVLVIVPRMYRLVKNKRFGTYHLRLSTTSAGLACYAFTFVSCVVGEGDGSH